MDCEICHQRPANVHVTKVVNNVRTELHICQQCARERGELQVFAGPKFMLSNLVAGLFQNEPGSCATVAIPGGARRTCSTCGLDYTEFMNTGFLGCSDCYSQFGPLLRPIIARIHGQTSHSGKVPARAGHAVLVKQKLEALRTQLRKHIEAEEYEKAAIVRDQIRSIERMQDGQEGDGGSGTSASEEGR